VLFVGVDLAWGESTETRAAADTGLAALDESGRITDAGWASGLAAALEWVEQRAAPDTLLFVDAPLVVDNESGQRLCEKQVGQRYGRWEVSANSTNLDSPNLGGVTLLAALEARGWRYSDGRDGPPTAGRVVSECYPYTTLVGVPELGYNDERPRYKRPPRRMPAAEWQPLRCAACDELIRRLSELDRADPPLDMRSHPETRRLIEEPSPVPKAAYKRREDLIDAVICAWTAAYWWRYGEERSQVLGVPADGTPGVSRVATIIAPARREQRGRT